MNVSENQACDFLTRQRKRTNISVRWKKHTNQVNGVDEGVIKGQLRKYQDAAVHPVKVQGAMKKQNNFI